jgi:AcrR family transcriptional regulator
MNAARARTSGAEIIAAGRTLLEEGGVEAVTMLAVADRVGVRAPSLYKRVAGRSALIAAIAEGTLAELSEAIGTTADDEDPAVALRAVAIRFRAFALANPRAYGLLFGDEPTEHRLTPEASARASQPVIGLATALVGPEHALNAARLLTAFVHGFISMEIGDAFRLGGNVDEAFRYGLDVLVDALSGQRRGRSTRRR